MDAEVTGGQACVKFYRKVGWNTVQSGLQPQEKKKRDRAVPAHQQELRVPRTAIFRANSGTCARLCHSTKDFCNII